MQRYGQIWTRLLTEHRQQTVFISVSMTRLHPVTDLCLKAGNGSMEILLSQYILPSTEDKVTGDHSVDCSVFVGESFISFFNMIWKIKYYYCYFII